MDEYFEIFSTLQGQQLSTYDRCIEMSQEWGEYDDD